MSGGTVNSEKFMLFIHYIKGDKYGKVPIEKTVSERRVPLIVHAPCSPPWKGTKKLALILCELKVLFAEGAAAVVLTVKPVLFAELYAFVVAVALFEVGRQPQRVARGKFFADGVK